MMVSICIYQWKLEEWSRYLNRKQRHCVFAQIHFLRYDMYAAYAQLVIEMLPWVSNRFWQRSHGLYPFSSSVWSEPAETFCTGNYGVAPRAGLCSIYRGWRNCFAVVVHMRAYTTTTSTHICRNTNTKCGNYENIVFRIYSTAMCVSWTKITLTRNILAAFVSKLLYKVQKVSYLSNLIFEGILGFDYWWDKRWGLLS